MSETPPAAPRRWTARRITGTIGLCALLSGAAFMADEWIPAPIWSLLNALFWIAGLVALWGLLLQRRKRCGVAAASLSPHTKARSHDSRREQAVLKDSGLHVDERSKVDNRLLPVNDDCSSMIDVVKVKYIAGGQRSC